MKHRLIRMLLVTTLLIAAPLVVLTGCSVEQTEEGEAPEVEVEGGNLPEYDVDAAEVEVTPEERTITVPDVEVIPPGEEGDIDGEVDGELDETGEADGVQP